MDLKVANVLHVASERKQKTRIGDSAILTSKGDEPFLIQWRNAHPFLRPIYEVNIFSAQDVDAGCMRRLSIQEV